MKCAMLEHLALFAGLIHLHQRADGVFDLREEHHCGDDIRLVGSLLVQGDCALGEFASRKNLSASELFTEYYKSMYSDEPPKDLLELFMEISEARDET